MLKWWLSAVLFCSMLVGFGQIGDSTTVDTIQSLLVTNKAFPDTATIQSGDVMDPVPMPTLRHTPNKWWVFLFSLLVVIAIGILKNISPSRHQIGFMSYVLSPKAENEIVEDNFGLDAFLISQISISCVILGWVVKLFQPFDLNFTLIGEFGIFLLCILCISLLYTVKFFIHHIVGIILQADRLSMLVVYSQANMLYSLCLFLFPCLMVYYYVPDASLKQIATVIIVALSLLHLITRWIKTARIYFEFFPYAKVYIFIYLCALEILPLLILTSLVLFNG